MGDIIYNNCSFTYIVDNNEELPEECICEFESDYDDICLDCYDDCLKCKSDFECPDCDFDFDFCQLSKLASPIVEEIDIQKLCDYFDAYSIDVFETCTCDAHQLCCPVCGNKLIACTLFDVEDIPIAYITFGEEDFCG